MRYISGFMTSSWQSKGIGYFDITNNKIRSNSSNLKVKNISAGKSRYCTSLN